MEWNGTRFERTEEAEMKCIRTGWIELIFDQMCCWPLYVCSSVCVCVWILKTFFLFRYIGAFSFCFYISHHCISLSDWTATPTNQTLHICTWSMQSILTTPPPPICTPFVRLSRTRVSKCFTVSQFLVGNFFDDKYSVWSIVESNANVVGTLYISIFRLVCAISRKAEPNTRSLLCCICLHMFCVRCREDATKAHTTTVLTVIMWRVCVYRTIVIATFWNWSVKIRWGGR